MCQGWKTCSKEQLCEPQRDTDRTDMAKNKAIRKIHDAIQKEDLPE